MHPSAMFIMLEQMGHCGAKPTSASEILVFTCSKDCVAPAKAGGSETCERVTVSEALITDAENICADDVVFETGEGREVAGDVCT